MNSGKILAYRFRINDSGFSTVGYKYAIRKPVSTKKIWTAFGPDATVRKTELISGPNARRMRP